MADFSRDTDIGKATSVQDRMEVLLINTLAAIQDDATDNKAALDEVIVELQKIRDATELTTEIVGE